MSKKAKTIALKRAYFSEGINLDVETVIAEVFAKLPGAENRIVAADLFKRHVLAHVEAADNNSGQFVRIFEFEDGAMGVINFASTDTAAEVEEFLPPEKQRFLSDEIVLLVTGNQRYQLRHGEQTRNFRKGGRGTRGEGRALRAASGSADRRCSQQDYDR